MLDISAFDPQTASAVAWAEYHEFRRARAEEDEPGEPIPSDADTEHDLRQHWPLFANQRFFAHRAGRLIGLLGVGWRRPESEGAEAHAPFIHAWGGVLAAERRQGVGTALLMPLAGLMRAQGKTTLTCSTTRPDGNAFLAAIGATLKHRSAENRLAFAGLDWGMLAAWNQVPADLTWEIHAGRAPFPRLRALVAPFNRLLADIPLGDLDLPPPRYELVGWKTWYGELDRRGGDHFIVMLHHGETLAGMCEASWDARYPDRVYQALTAVTPAWRNRGLAKALKSRMLHLVRAHHPEASLMITSNANVNAPILAINSALGFVLHRQDWSYQMSRATLETYLSRQEPADEQP